MQYPDRIVMQFVSNLHGTRIRMSLPSHLHASPVPTIHGLIPPLPKNEASYRPSVSRTHTDTHTDAPQKPRCFLHCLAGHLLSLLRKSSWITFHLPNGNNDANDLSKAAHVQCWRDSRQHHMKNHAWVHVLILRSAPTKYIYIIFLYRSIIFIYILPTPRESYSINPFSA